MAIRTAIFVGVVLLGLLVPGAAPGSAQVAPVNHIVVRKVVEGPAPAGAVFVVHAGCTNEAPDAPTLGVLDQTFTFDAQGNPPAVTLDVPTNLSDNSFVLCDITEISGFPTGPFGIGQPSLYDCEVTSPGTSNPPGGPDATCGLLRADATVEFPFSRVDAVATVTITNRFVAPPTAEPPTSVFVPPTFTG